MRYGGRLQGASRLRRPRSLALERRSGWAATAPAPAAGLFVGAIGFSLAFAAGGGDLNGSSRLAADRADARPTKAPLAVVGIRSGDRVRVTRRDPLTLAPRRWSHRLGEYRDTYSFAPGGKRIAFGTSAVPFGSATGCCGRVGIRLVRKRNLTVSANIRTGSYAAAVAWLRTRRLVALTPGTRTVRTVNPKTGRTLKRRTLPFGDFAHCDAADARERALIVLVGRNLFVIGPDGGVRTFELPPEFAGCEQHVPGAPDIQIALAPGGERAFVVAEGGDPIAELELESSELTVHGSPTGAVGKVDAIGLAQRRLALARRGPSGRRVELLDLEVETQRTIDDDAGKAHLVKGTVLTYDGRRRLGAAGSGVRGVRGYRPDGQRRFQLLGGKRIAKVVAVGRFAYAMHTRGLAVIDVPSGTVVSRSSTRPPLGARFLTRP
jgi:hypothetical protein